MVSLSVGSLLGVARQSAHVVRRDKLVLTVSCSIELLVFPFGTLQACAVGVLVLSVGSTTPICWSASCIVHDRDVFWGDLITSTESSQLLSRCIVVAAGAPVKCRVAEEESSPASAESHSRTNVLLQLGSRRPSNNWSKVQIIILQAPFSYSNLQRRLVGGVFVGMHAS